MSHKTTCAFKRFSSLRVQSTSKITCIRKMNDFLFVCLYLECSLKRLKYINLLVKISGVKISHVLFQLFHFWAHLSDFEQIWDKNFGQFAQT